MSDYDDSTNTVTLEEKTGGKKKSNGHKATCKCPICKNMQMKKGGSMPTLRPANFIGGKKANGHKANCKCPICVNMKHQNASKKNRRVKRSKRTRRGGRMIPPSGTPTEVEAGDDYALIPPDNNNNAVQLDDSFEVDNADIGVVRDANQNDDNNDNANVGNRLFGDDDDNDDSAQGGKKKRKGNGHKANCKCPICKNMKMKKGGAADDDSDSDSDSSDSSSDSDSNSSSDSDSDAAMGGGKKKRKGNGHKSTCKCPICKNMKKGGVGPYDDNKEQKNPNENIDLEMGSEDGEAKEYQDKRSKVKPIKPKPKSPDGLPRPFTDNSGGSRRRRKTRKSRKTRKIRRRR